MTMSNEAGPNLVNHPYLPTTPWAEMTEDQKMEYLRLADLIDADVIHYDRIPHISDEPTIFPVEETDI